MPAWGTLIGLMRHGKPVFGMMHQPFTREKFTGDGVVAHYTGPAGKRDLRVRTCSQLSEATVYTTSPRLMTDQERTAFAAVENAARLSRYGGDCYAYCMLAAGHLDLVIETGLKAYDITALIPIITGAGGIITTWQNESAENGGRIIAAGDARTHKAALDMLNANL
jgi:myo-inositol-1(or 4)-monophosphatase